ncbi:MAG: aminotransferase class V-fold PLP-dependent enzyme [Acidimicrobiales bacterium]
MSRFAKIRDRFPGCSSTWARFDAPAGSQPVDDAIEATAEFQRSGLVSNSHGMFPMTDACDALVAATRGTVARLLGAPTTHISFGPSATAMILHLTRSLTNALEAGDEVICTQLEHDANVSPWIIAAQEAGATVSMAQMDAASGRLSIEAVSSLFGERTRWLAITGASNAIGTIPDLVSICEIARQADVRVLVDGVHLTPHCPVDLTEIGCDAFVTSAYKWYGPHLSCMWMSDELASDVVPYRIRPAPESGPESWQMGTPAYEAIAGVNAAALFLLGLGMDKVREHELATFTPLLRGLQDMDHVRTYGPCGLDERTPTVAFNVAGRSADETAGYLADREVAVWSGHYYALETMSALGLGEVGGAVRAGVSVYTSPGEVDRLLDVVAGMA